MKTNLPSYYKIKVAGLERDLPVRPINDKLSIAGFVMLGDFELTHACAAELCKLLPEHDFMIAPEAKSIALINEMASILGEKKHFVARKGLKAAKEQTLYLDCKDAEMMKGKKVVIVDDVISTGELLSAVEQLVKKAGGIVVGCAAVLAEGDAADRTDITYLEKLPLFFS